MEKEKLLKELKAKCRKIIADCTDERKLNIYEKIAQIMEVPNAFARINVVTAINILVDLGYTKEEAKALYPKLI